MTVRQGSGGAPREALGGGSRKTPVASALDSPQTMLGLYRPDIAQALSALDAPGYRYAQVYEHLLRRPLQRFAAATTLPAQTRRALDSLGTSTLETVGSRTAPDGTVKFLVSGRDGLCVETVLMPYRDRITVCISSQVGCPVGCVFCATGSMGFARNLSAAEIVDQVRTAATHATAEGRRLSNVVFMGMGEPLLNLQAVLDSIRILTDPRGLGLGHRALSVSTVGIPAAMLKLAKAEPQVNLALSLQATDDRTRALLIPKSHRHPVSEVLEAAWEHFAITHRKLLVEYVLLHGINDSADDARRLAGLLRGHVVTVNLLAWNPTPGRSTRAAKVALPVKSGHPGSRDGASSPPAFEAPSRQVASSFRDTLLGAGVEAVIRHSKGSGIQAACGQLAGRHRST
ncbi:MAG: 23S rRNA (adenine(2503)-C(2))-methyltransferase RlmN [Thermoleophilia bacterium]|nr:23S rRNA (adenine(2503)-C(2))-methyltransferase RlmN [Thermoleophilia bacterium]